MTAVRITDSSTADLYRIESGRLERPPAALIAATALHHRMILVTRNERDFADTGVEIANPWATA